MSFEKDPLEYWMNKQTTKAAQWSEPECFDPNHAGDRRGMYSHVAIGKAKVERKVALIAEDLFEMNHPDQKNNVVARERYMKPIMREGTRYGKWYYFPWSNQLVQYPEAEDHRKLLAYRNRELITSEELRILSSATTVHVGLSVGSHIVTQVAHMGLGNKVILADPDIVSVPNLNRIHAGVPEVGMRKTDVAGIRLSELNPYVKQIHFADGMNPRNAELTSRYRPNVLFEEVDHMPTKILMRKLARQAGAALIMATDTGDLSMIDIERYDLGDNEPFLGKLTMEDIALIENGALSSGQTVRLIEKLIGRENISSRLERSIGQIGITLGGIAQLGTTASVGAAYAAVAGREIVLGRGPATGRYKISPQSVFRLQEP